MKELEQQIKDNKIKQAELEAELEAQQAITETQNDVCSNMANLASAYSTLADIDRGMLDKTDQKKIEHLENKIIKSMLYFADQLPG